MTAAAIVVAALINAAALYVLARAVVLAAQRLARVIPQQALTTEPGATNVADFAMPIVTVPNDVLDFVNAESEPWARSGLMNRAMELYAESDDWAVVLQTLRAENIDVVDTDIAE